MSAANRVPLPALYFRYMGIWFGLGWPAFLSVAAAFSLTVIEPA
jgi:uncharacterized membrane protein